VFYFYKTQKLHLCINQKFFVVSTLNPKTLFRRILLYFLKYILILLFFLSYLVTISMAKIL